MASHKHLFTFVMDRRNVVSSSSHRVFPRAQESNRQPLFWCWLVFCRIAGAFSVGLKKSNRIKSWSTKSVFIIPLFQWSSVLGHLFLTTDENMTKIWNMPGGGVCAVGGHNAGTQSSLKTVLWVMVTIKCHYIWQQPTAPTLAQVSPKEGRRNANAK